MSYDASRFSSIYFAGASRPLPDGWRVVGVQSDRVRSAIDVSLQNGLGAPVLVFVERRVEGGESLAQTDRLQLSYYAEPTTDHGAAASATRALARVLAEVEAETPAERLEEAMTVAMRTPTARKPRTLELRINRECNEVCVFCNTPEGSETILPSPEAIHAAIRRERAAGYEALTLTGRETTLDPNLPAYLEAAREVGYTTRRVQTNGTTFARGPLLERLVEAGMTHAEISLHTLDPGVFRRLVGPPRLLDKTLVAIERLAEHPGVEVHLVIVLTRLNLDHIPAVLERALAANPRIEDITISPMAPVGDGKARVDLVPRPDELREPLRLAFAAAARFGVRMRVPSRCGAPLCAMPEGTEHLNDEMDNAPGHTLEGGKAKLEKCSECIYDSRCTGLWVECVRAWGPDAVRPVRG